MSIPDFQTLMLPLLKLAGDRVEHSFKEAIPFLATMFALTEEEKRELLPSGKQSKFNNQVYWTKTHLLKAGLLDSDRRGAFKITESGLNVLAANPPSIDTKFLERYDKYCEFRTPGKSKEQYVFSKAVERETTKEALENAYQKLQSALSIELLEAIRQCSSSCFESLVIDLLIAMGYGASHQEVRQALRRSPNKGIDGIIKSDRLGLNTIYIWAECRSNQVSSLEIQKFVKTLLDRSISQGIFITTSDFSQGAVDSVTNTDRRIVLIDGGRLAKLTIEYNVGVTPVAKYEVKKLDSDYFIEN